MRKTDDSVYECGALIHRDHECKCCSAVVYLQGSRFKVYSTTATYTRCRSTCASLSALRMYCTIQYDNT